MNECSVLAMSKTYFSLEKGVDLLPFSESILVHIFALSCSSFVVGMSKSTLLCKCVKFPTHTHTNMCRFQLKIARLDCWGK